MKENDRVLLIQNNHTGMVVQCIEFVSFTVQFDDGEKQSYNWNDIYSFNIIGHK